MRAFLASMYVICWCALIRYRVREGKGRCIIRILIKVCRLRLFMGSFKLVFCAFCA